MNLVFTNTALLPWAILVGVPILLHLFARARPPRYPFSSTEFIERIVRQTMRLRRPREWLLLALRTLLFAALILAFLMPRLFARGRAPIASASRQVVLVVDATASMACVDGPQTRFAAACAEASEVLRGLGSADRANIIWLRAQPEAVFPEMGVNVAYLQSVLRRARVSLERGDIASAIRRAVAMLDHEHGAAELCLVSDFQASAWTDVALDIPEGIAVTAIPVGREDVPNAAVTRVTMEPARPIVGEACSLYAEVHNFAAQPRRTTVFLEAGETRDTQELVVPAWGSAVAVFRHSRLQAGPALAALSLEPDSFPADDTRWRAFDVRPYLAVGVAAGEADTAAVWTRALNALEWARPEMLDGEWAARADAFDALMLSAWNGESLEPLRAFVRGGGTVVCAPAAGAAAANVLALAGTAAAPGARSGTLVRMRDKAGWSVRIGDADDPVFALFRGGDYGDPAAGTFYARLHGLVEAAFDSGRPLLTYADEVPGLLKIAGPGTVLVWNLPLGAADSDWARQPEFLTFFGELLLTARAAPQLRLTDFAPGDAVTWSFAQEVLDAEVDLRPVGAPPLTIHRVPSHRGATFAGEPSTATGPYAWSHRDTVMGYCTVNFPDVESDLRVMSAEAVAALTRGAVAHGGQVRELQEGLPLWPMLLAAAGVAALAELALLIWMERT